MSIFNPCGSKVNEDNIHRNCHGKEKTNLKKKPFDRPEEDEDINTNPKCPFCSSVWQRIFRIFL